MSKYILPCVFCLREDSARLLLDKKSRPYIVCSACAMRTFARSVEALRGYFFVAPRIMGMWKEALADGTHSRSDLERRAEEAIERVKRDEGSGPERGIDDGAEGEVRL